MTRSHVAILALAALLTLTFVLGRLVDTAGSAAAVGAVAALKVAIIGAVFLELDRSRPLWAVLAAGWIGGVLGLAAMWIGG